MNRAEPRAGVWPALAGIALAVLLAAPVWAAVPPPRGHVNDFAEVIDPQTEAALDEELRALARETGAEVAVAAVESVPDGDIEGAAVDWFRAWGVGRRERDDGALILCAVRDRKVRIEVGYGLEPVLPDAVCGRIIRDVMVPAFREGRFGDGLAAGARAVAARIRAGVPEAGPPPADWRSEELIFLVVFVLVIGLSLWIASRASRARPARQRWYGREWEVPGGFGGGAGGDFGGGGFGGGGDFGGFGGGSSGGGGASGSW